MMMFDDKMGGWGWPNADVIRNKKKKCPRTEKLFWTLFFLIFLSGVF